VEFAVGPPALARRASTKRAGLAAARTLGTGVEDLPTVAARLREENAELETALRDLRAEVLDGRFASLEPVEKDGHTWRIGEIDGFDSNELGDRAQAFVGDGTDVLALVGGAGRAFVVVAAAPDAAVAAGDVVSRVTEEFGGGGGGGPTFAQGGGLDAEPADVAAFLRS
jgi:alanyl-tRNA synthetase